MKQDLLRHLSNFEPMNPRWIKYHLIFFAITWVFNYIFNFYFRIPGDRLLSYSLFFLVENIFLMAYFYSIMLLSLMLLNRMIYFIPFQLVFMLLGCFLLSLNPYFFYKMEHATQAFSTVYFMKMFDVAYMTFSGLGFLFLVKWSESMRQKSQLIESLGEAELLFLRSQMSPHFLLNTLNSIYSLALNKSPEIYSAIAELKSIYSYVQRSEGKVLLKKEIKYLESFINIQKRRFRDAVELTVSFEFDKDYEIEPLLLSSFMENAFKHGVSMKEYSYINIKLSVLEGRLEYLVVNSNHSLKYKDATSGIGVQNLSRRLELLYPDAFSLKYIQESSSYTAHLIIQQI